MISARCFSPSRHSHSPSRVGIGAFPGFGVGLAILAEGLEHFLQQGAWFRRGGTRFSVAVVRVTISADSIGLCSRSFSAHMSPGWLSRRPTLGCSLRRTTKITWLTVPLTCPKLLTASSEVCQLGKIDVAGFFQTDRGRKYCVTSRLVI